MKIKEFFSKKTANTKNLLICAVTIAIVVPLTFVIHGWAYWVAFAVVEAPSAFLVYKVKLEAPEQE
jgi:hypothetical protein